MSAPELPRAGVVLPSVMSADMLALGAQLDALIAAGARVVHVDVMDGHFVPNLTVGPDFTRAVAGALPRRRRAGGRPPDGLAARRDDPALRADGRRHHRARRGRPAPAPPARGDPRGGLPRRASRSTRAPRSSTSPSWRTSSTTSTCSRWTRASPGSRSSPPRPRRIARLRALLPDRVVIEVDGGIGTATLPGARGGRGRDVRVGLVDLRRARPGRRLSRAGRAGGRRMSAPRPPASAVELAALARARDLALRGRGRVSPNPLVGAVVLRDGETVAEGWHEGPGLPHAEAMALAAAGRRRPRRDGGLHPRALLAPRAHAALRRRPDRGRRRAGS